MVEIELVLSEDNCPHKLRYFRSVLMTQVTCAWCGYSDIYTPDYEEQETND